MLAVVIASVLPVLATLTSASRERCMRHIDGIRSPQGTNPTER